MKENAKVRSAVTVIEGICARRYGYEIKDETIRIGNGGVFSITSAVEKRLIELGY